MTRLAILIYCQHLAGTGHFVRSFEIARSLSARHDVWLVDGGREVPRAGGTDVRSLRLPRIRQQDGVLLQLDDAAGIEAVMTRRGERLDAAIESIRPDVLIVEHFPFSKWILAGEIERLIATVRTRSPRSRVLCSVRDLIPPSRLDGDLHAHRQRVAATLAAHFDGVLVHGDPDIARLEEHHPWLLELAIPVWYTGYVSEPCPAVRADHPRGHIVVSTGGAGNGSLAARCVEAWRAIAGSGRGRGRRLVVFAPGDHGTGCPDRSNKEPGPLIAEIDERPFGTDFLEWMATADLTVSHAGYNTCANILQCGTRAIVVPEPSMSDQSARARRLAERGLVRALDDAECSVERLAHEMLAALATPHTRLVHGVDLDGATRTLELVERICLPALAHAAPQ